MRLSEVVKLERIDWLLIGLIIIIQLSGQANVWLVREGTISQANHFLIFNALFAVVVVSSAIGTLRGWRPFWIIFGVLSLMSYFVGSLTPIAGAVVLFQIVGMLIQ